MDTWLCRGEPAVSLQIALTGWSSSRLQAIYRSYSRNFVEYTLILIKENRRMWTCNWLDLQTLGYQPVMPKNLPDHWYKDVKNGMKWLGFKVSIPKHVTWNWHLETLYNMCISIMKKYASWTSNIGIGFRLLTTEIEIVIIIAYIFQMMHWNLI